jgi:trehalose-6-phosphate synthase
VETPNGFSAVGTFPIGIDAGRFKAALRTQSVKDHTKELRQQFDGTRVILGIDRLDYTKGIPHKLFAMERFLQNNPEWIGKVVLVQIAVPSRGDVPEYQRLSKKVHQLVGRINGRFGTLTHVPIHLLDTSIGFDRMCALYRSKHTHALPYVCGYTDLILTVCYSYMV